jgi:hypothetical protein
MRMILWPIRRLTRAVLALCVPALAATCLSGAAATTGVLPAGGHHVLFIGNSLTYTNDLPATVAAIAAAAGDTLRVTSVAGPNLALIDHLNGATNAVAVMAREKWEYVVLQQGPTPRGICRDSLVLWTRMFDPHIRAAGATPALFMTWPSIPDAAIFDDVRISFQNAAQAVGGVFIPAGESWRAALRESPSLGLYGLDGFHPSSVGSFLAALTIYERLTGRDVRTLPPVAFSEGRPLTLPEATVRLLQRAAHEANTQWPARPAPNGSIEMAPVASVAASC